MSTFSSISSRPGEVPSCRREAKRLGLKHFQSDRPCPAGHVGLRYANTGICVICHRERALKVSRADPPAHRQKTKQWRRANPEKYSEYRKGWYRNNQEQVRARVRDNRYLLQRGQFEAMLVAQDSRCLGCCEPFNETPNVDHCHLSGRVRGLLCGHCNRSLAFAKDNRDTLLRLAGYLKKFEGDDA